MTPVRIAGATSLGYVTEYLITWLKLRCVSANRFDPTRYGSSEYLVLRLQEPGAHQAKEPRSRSQETPVTRIHGCRVNLYEYFIVLGSRFVYLLEMKNIG